MGGALTPAEILTGFVAKLQLSRGPPAWRRGRIGAARALPPFPHLRPSRAGGAAAGPARHVPEEAEAPAVSAASRPGRAAAGWDPGVSLQGCPLPRGAARAPKPGPRGSRRGRGSPRGQGKLRGRLPPAPGSPAGSARARGQAALTHGTRPLRCRPGALPCPCQQRGAPSPLRTMTIWVQPKRLEWGGRRV